MGIATNSFGGRHHVTWNIEPSARERLDFHTRQEALRDFCQLKAIANANAPMPPGDA